MNAIVLYSDICITCTAIKLLDFKQLWLGFLVVYVLIELILFVYLFYLWYPQLVKCIAIHLTPIIKGFFWVHFCIFIVTASENYEHYRFIRSHGTVLLIYNKSLILGTGIKVDVIHSIRVIVIKH